MNGERTRNACLKASFTDLPRCIGPDPVLLASLQAAVEEYRAEYDTRHGAGAFQRKCDAEWEGPA